MFFRKKITAGSAARTIKTFGLDEAAVRERLYGSGLSPDMLSHPKGVDIMLKAEAESGPAALAALDAAEQKVRKRLGQAVFGIEKDRMEETVGKLLAKAKMTLAVAESCTGGLICHMLTNVPGCSEYFRQGFIVYDEHAKINTLGVDRETLEKSGSVSAETAREMAENAKSRSGADAAIAVSGIAGPGGGNPQKPVGTVFISALAGGAEKTAEFHFEGWRELIKIQAAQTALDSLRRILENLE